MRNMIIALWMLLCSMTRADAQVSVEIGVNIGINLPAYPELVLVPDYPVYYAPGADWNYFFYDGVYWVYLEDSWYASSWYNGPWQLVGPEDVPLFVLRVPVRYYRQPPAYFRGWVADAPPRWGEHWGRDWERRRGGWDRWDRRSAPPAAPLPVYQRAYSGDRYPRAAEQQHSIRSEKYRYQPREAVAQQHFQQPASPRPEPQHQAPVRQTQPSQPTQQVKPVQAPPRMQQHPEAAPQDRDRGKGAAAQEKRQEQKAAVQDNGHEKKAAAQDKRQEQKAAVQDKRQEQKAAAQDKGHEKKAAAQDKDRKEERGQDRH
jgi:hypothetical protein